MKFESIHPKIWEYARKVSRLGADTVINQVIPWQEVAWARQIATKEYIPVVYQSDTDHILVKLPDGESQRTKKDLAYMCDLYDKNGGLLSVAFWGL